MRLVIAADGRVTEVSVVGASGDPALRSAVVESSSALDLRTRARRGSPRAVDRDSPFRLPSRRRALRSVAPHAQGVVLLGRDAGVEATPSVARAAMHDGAS
jgi:hypothetical protein